MQTEEGIYNTSNLEDSLGESFSNFGGRYDILYPIKDEFLMQNRVRHGESNDSECLIHHNELQVTSNAVVTSYENRLQIKTA